MIVVARVPWLGAVPGLRIDPSDAPVRDPSVSYPIGKVVACRCVERDWVEITMELDEGILTGRLREARGAF